MLRRVGPFIRLLLPLLAFCGSSRAQYSPVPSKGGQEAATTFSSRSELVLVPVLVRDDSGAHVPHLKATDFIVRENGKAQKIALLEEIHPTTKGYAKPEFPANEFHNFAGDQDARTLVIIALDWINTPEADQLYARKQLVKYLSEMVDSSALLSLLVIGRGHIKVVHDFNSDPALLIAAMKKIHNQPNADAGLGGHAAELKNLASEMATRDAFLQKDSRWFLADSRSSLANAMAASAMNADTAQRRLTIQHTLDAMRVVARAYGGIPGRKAVIWATAGFPFTIVDSMIQDTSGMGHDSFPELLSEYEATWQAMNDASISVYPVDVRGLVGSLAPDATQSVSIAPDQGSAVPGNVRATQQREYSLAMTLSTLEQVARTTGGKAFYNTNDLSGAFRSAREDCSAYYLLGYYLDKGSKPGWHKLHVDVSRKHLQVRARSGFFVKASPDPARQDMMLALRSPLDLTGLPLTVKWTTKEKPPQQDKRKIGFEISLPANAATIDAGDKNHVCLEFAALALTSAGVVSGESSHTLDGRLSATAIAEIQRGVRYHEVLNLDPGDYLVRFVVRDHLSGRMGSLTAPLTVQ